MNIIIKLNYDKLFELFYKFVYDDINGDRKFVFNLFVELCTLLKNVYL